VSTLTRTAWGLDSPRGGEWLDHVACRDHPEREPDDWHPISAHRLSDANLAALRVCRRECPVRQRCADYYAAHPELLTHPVIAGGEPHGMSVDAVRSGERRLGTLPACDGLTGTRSGYLRHLVLRSPPCEPCTAANRQAWRDRVAV